MTNVIDLNAAQGLKTAQFHTEHIRSEFLAVLNDKQLSTIGRRIERANIVNQLLQSYTCALRDSGRSEGTPGFDICDLILNAFNAAVQQRFPSALPDDVNRLSELYVDVKRMLVEAKVMFHELVPLGVVNGSIGELFLSTMRGRVAQLPNFASQQIAVGAAMSLLHKVRDGRLPKKTLTAASNAVQLALLLIPETQRKSIHTTLIADPYVTACASYYEKNRKHLDTKDIDRYLQQVNTLLCNEEELCMEFTGDKQTAIRSKRAMQTKLLADQRNDIVKFGALKTMSNPENLDPKKFSLFVNLFDFDNESVDLIHKSLSSSVAAAIKEVSKQSDAIDAASRVALAYRDFVITGLADHTRITYLVAVEDGIRDGLNAISDVDELLAYHFDAVIKRSPTELSTVLERSSLLLSAAHDEIFFEFYKQLLAVRLLTRLGSSTQAERAALTSLRSVRTVPQHFFAHLETMLAEAPSRLCNDHIWPEPIVEKMTLSPAIEEQVQHFIQSENSRRAKTRVVADLALTTVEAVVSFSASEQPCFVIGTAPQITALTTLIERKKISSQEFAGLSGIADAVAKGLLATIAATSLATLTDEGEFVFNERFMDGQDKKKKIVLPNYTRRKARR